MPIEADDPGFLSRWSQRKTLQRKGVALIEPVAPAAVEPAAVDLVSVQPAALTTQPAADLAPPDLAPADAAPGPPAAPAQPAPSLADVALLTRESDYTRFLSPGVQPEVKNAALAKLFTDPHFNVMDRLDVYIDDYGKPDPLPAGMLRQMLQAHVLGLFDAEEVDPKLAPPAPTPATANAAALPLHPEPAPDEDTDLQLQPNDGAGRPGLEAGAGEDAGQPH
ncbi:MAG: DUF3306 domain-containing protein [Rubrivivax sp.]|nr:DUF3306 domain-containing protein [Rubrivivax sp.]